MKTSYKKLGGIDLFLEKKQNCKKLLHFSININFQTPPLDSRPKKKKKNEEGRMK